MPSPAPVPIARRSLLTRAFLDPEGRVRNGWKVLLFFPAYTLGIYLLVLPLLRLKPIPDAEWPELVAATAAALMVSAIFLAIERRPFTSLGFRLNRAWAAHFALGTAGGMALMTATAFTIHALDGFHWVSTPLSLRSLLEGVGLYLLVALHEETVFRGYPFQRLIEGTRPWIAQAVFALLFAYVHWDNPGMTGGTRVWATLNIGLAALLLGLCYLKTHSLAAPIGLHLGWNWAQGSLLGFGVSGTTSTPGLWTPVFHGQPDWLTGGSFGLEASLPCALLCSGAIVLLALWKGSRAGLHATDAPSEG